MLSGRGIASKQKQKQLLRKVRQIYCDLHKTESQGAKKIAKRSEEYICTLKHTLDNPCPPYYRVCKYHREQGTTSIESTHLKRGDSGNMYSGTMCPLIWREEPHPVVLRDSPGPVLRKVSGKEPRSTACTASTLPAVLSLQE